MTVLYGFLGGVAGSVATLSTIGLVVRRSLRRSPLASMMKPKANASL